MEVRREQVLKRWVQPDSGNSAISINSECIRCSGGEHGRPDVFGASPSRLRLNRRRIRGRVQRAASGPSHRLFRLRVESLRLLVQELPQKLAQLRRVLKRSAQSLNFFNAKQ